MFVSYGNLQQLLEHDIAFFRSRYNDRQRSRIKKMKTLEKRQAAREKAKTEVDLTAEKKENWVYQEGTNYNIRWSALPR